jgi:hypothetical protein
MKQDLTVIGLRGFDFRNNETSSCNLHRITLWVGFKKSTIDFNDAFLIRIESCIYVEYC